MIDTGEPMLVGDGPAEASTCLAMVLWPLMIWDVNGYYRALGVNPRATRKQLREAYAQAGGPSSERLTYILKTLLNPVLRKHYDSLSIGEVFIDRYIVEAVRKAKVLKASRAAQKGVSIDVDAELRAVFGLPPQRDEEEGQTPLDAEAQEREASTGPPDVRPQSLPPWRFAYYLWRTTTTDTTNLAEWQELLVSELGRRGEVIRIAVGHHDRHPNPVLVGSVGYRVVVFLHRDEKPSAALAAIAGDRVVEHLASIQRERVLA